MLRTAWHYVRMTPATALIVAVAVGLFAAVKISEWRFPERAAMASRACGAVQELVLLRAQTLDGPLQPIPELSGPFDLWNGQWWRIPLSGFHHAGIVHLVMNGLGIWFLGWLLEPRMNRFAYLALFVSATTISLLPEFWLEHDVVGLSGGVYALFGVLLVLRRRDRHVAVYFSDGVVQFGFVWLFGCIALTYFDILQIANVAHFCGLAYGWIAGQLLFGVRANRRMLRWSFVAAHALLVPAIWYLVHPVWNGRYHWYLAINETDPQRQMAHLQAAVDRDPGLALPWVHLADGYAKRGDWPLAWKTVLEGMDHNRSDETCLTLARRLWKVMQLTGQQELALRMLRETFPDEADAFEERLRIGPELVAGDIGLLDANEEIGPLAFPREPLWPVYEEWAWAKERNLEAPPVDPDSPDSAMEGVTL